MPSGATYKAHSSVSTLAVEWIEIDTTNHLNLVSIVSTLAVEWIEIKIMGQYGAFAGVSTLAVEWIEIVYKFEEG